MLTPITEALEDLRQGKPVILVDDEDRENEGDLVVAAEKITPDGVNFMAREGRGLICLALTNDVADRLDLPPMAARNEAPLGTAFTVSIEAREGVTTGISAHDRAHTIQTAIRDDARARDLVRPGHIFPLRARDGGVLVRNGQTEGSVDLCRLAGLKPAGVICEIMNDDGTMARLPDLIGFAQRHGLKIGTISDLIAYRHRHDNLVRQSSERKVTSAYGGEWNLKIFTDETDGTEHVALSKGDLGLPGAVLVRTHALNPLEDVLGLGPTPVDELPKAMEIIAKEGRGVVVLFREPAKKLVFAGEVSPQTLRHTGLGAQILSALGLREITLLTDSPLPKIIGLDAYGLNITGTRSITKG